MNIVSPLSTIKVVYGKHVFGHSDDQIRFSYTFVPNPQFQAHSSSNPWNFLSKKNKISGLMSSVPENSSEKVTTGWELFARRINQVGAFSPTP